MNEVFCPVCGEIMEYWNQGIYECPECENMIDVDILDGEGEEDDF